ncbi:hypothetical protein ACYT6K_09695 [Streptococcus pyogenes]|nr:hypothetical protein [Enhydrobacter sp. 8BJ]VXA93784.1 conserved hypothetical protein [Enhydrobacter sp. 8BJ]
MNRYSVLLHFQKPTGGSGGTKWISNINASSEAEAKSIALNEAKSSEPTYTWRVDGVRKV